MFKDRKLNPNNGHRFMPYIVVIIDEYGDLIMTAGKEIELPIARIAQLARAVGIHMIIATQRPTANIITGTIKANFPARMAFKVSAMVDHLYFNNNLCKAMCNFEEKKKVVGKYKCNLKKIKNNYL